MYSNPVPSGAMPAEPTPPTTPATEWKGAVFFRSLGCPKNQLDTEIMLGSLAAAGYGIAERIEDAEIAVINTCSFIESAREESVEAILEVADLRDEGSLRSLIVAGCLPQRYGAELAKELPEVDAFIGTAAFRDIASILDEALAGNSRGVYVEAGRTHLYDESAPRVLLGAGHSAYIKIAEGCDRVCAFCAIPGIRGAFQSRSLDSVVAEARQLAERGVREINLVAQDSTSWGKDLPAVPQRGRSRLADLLRALDDVPGPEWIRLLYVYPTAVDDALIDALGHGQRVLPYVDIPLQHGSDAMLRAMRRGTTAARQRDLVAKLRDRIPGLTLRTTVIVGFPGETDRDFEELLAFVEESQFDRLGVFRYSDEEGTAAERLPNKVPRAVARERYRRLTACQQDIMKRRLSTEVGRQDLVLVDSVLGRERAIGRLASQAPEIDGVVHLTTKTTAQVGELRPVRITGVRDVDLVASG